MCDAARQICVRPRFGYFAIPRAAARGSIGRVQAETGEREGALATIAQAAAAVPAAGGEAARASISTSSPSRK